MEDDMPTVILSVVVILILLAIGSFIFYTVYTEIGYTKSQTEYFTVSDPSNDVEVELRYYPEQITAVYQYNGFEWVPVDSAYYSVNVKTVTVDKNGLQG